MARTKRPQGYKVRRMQGDILTARPEGMDYETYRQKRRDQQKQLRDRLRGGFMVWKSKCLTIVNKDGTKTVKGENWGTLVGKVPSIVFVD